jgi:hypothetical protein
MKTDDVLGYFTPAEQAMLQNILQQADTLSPKITDCVGSVRGFISAGANQVDGASLVSIPDQLRPQTIAYIAWEWLSSFPGLEKFKTKDREARATEAKNLFAQVGSQKPDRPRIELPDTPLAKAAPVGAVQIARKGVRVNRRGIEKMGGS